MEFIILGNLITDLDWDDQDRENSFKQTIMQVKMLPTLKKLKGFIKVIERKDPQNKTEIIIKISFLVQLKRVNRWVSVSINYCAFASFFSPLQESEFWMWLSYT